MIENWLFYYPLLIIAMVLFGLIGWLLTGGNKTIQKILDYMVDNHLDEWEVSKSKIVNGVDATKEDVEKALKTLMQKGIMYQGKHGYALLDPLVFLTTKDYSRARRLTKNDNILFGGYQVPYETNLYYILSEISLGIIGVIFLVLTYFNSFSLATYLENVFGVAPLAVALFILAILIVIGDVFNNFLKYWTRERYSIVIGEKSGISYDLSLADDLSGRLERHAIDKVDINMSLLQKFVSSFKAVPIGDLRVWKKGADQPIVFNNIPYPREAFFIIRGIQLGALEWRKKHAKNISYWKSGSKPVFT